MLRLLEGLELRGKRKRIRRKKILTNITHKIKTAVLYNKLNDYFITKTSLGRNQFLKFVEECTEVIEVTYDKEEK